MSTLQSTDENVSNPPKVKNSARLGIRGSRLLFQVITTFFLASGAIIILIPLVYMVSISLKSPGQLRTDPLNPIPTTSKMVEVNGKNEPVYTVTLNGQQREMALIKKAPKGNGIFVDPANPDERFTLIIAEQSPVNFVEIHPENYVEALTAVPFDRYLINTLLVTFVGMSGMLLSCSLVAYGFSRFRAPWLNILFIVLLSTVMLPRQVTLIPVYILYQKIGWIDTLLPLIVPQFFANAYDVFLLRQFFMTIPLELDDAAKIDGANSWQTLLYVILPQSRAALISIAIFHFLYAWNDFYEPLIFLQTQKNWTMAVGLQTFNALYSNNTHLIMAASVVMIIPPIVLFFLAQRFFMQGVVISGVKG